MSKIICFLIVLVLFFSCESKKDPTGTDTLSNNSKQLFNYVSVESSGIDFQNVITEDDQFNVLGYEYLYNGAGLAAGDLNNDGLIDLYFVGNMVPDKLYINEGGLKFRDASLESGIDLSSGWRTGVSMADFNQDGLLDIYICRSGLNPDNRSNLLYLNNGDLTFSEEAAKYGLDSNEPSLQAAYLDFDLDGDLDIYLLNHPVEKPQIKDISSYKASIRSGELITDQFFINEGGTYKESTKAVNLYNYGFRHGVGVSDLNNDDYPDLFVSSDFDDPDHLFINQEGRSFSDEILSNTAHISKFSMGNDLADINNDGYTDMIVVDMTPDDHFREKTNMKPMSPERFNMMVDQGFHHQYMFNALQLNRGNGQFSEIANLSGVAKTDWSWAPLFADLDNDGWKDLFVTNGIKRNFFNRDVPLKVDNLTRQKGAGAAVNINEILALMPTGEANNYLFRNKGDLGFEDMSTTWASPLTQNSNGAVYADLDNDGDLDLVTNNVDGPVTFYQNLTSDRKAGNFIKIKFKGIPQNPFGVGAKIWVRTNDFTQFYEHYPTRGYYASMPYELNIGIGQSNSVAEVLIYLPKTGQKAYSDVQAGTTLTADVAEFQPVGPKPADEAKLMEEENVAAAGINFRHQENEVDDFKREILLPHKQSAHGPCLSTGDVNGDNLTDVFVGGAAGQEGALFIQQKNGKFKRMTGQPFSADKAQEDLGSLFFDADQDGDLDLYVSKGEHDPTFSPELLADKLYLNDGKGNFTRSEKALPEIQTSTKVIASADYDGDGDQDLFVGGRNVPGQYPMPAKSYLLQNDNGVFTNVTFEICPQLVKPGMISDAIFSDYDGDQDIDLLVVGEWMPVRVFQNEGGKFKEKTKDLGLDERTGWYFSITALDVDNDGDQDYLIGNVGKNNKFHPTADHPLHVYAHDFDQSGTLDIVLGKEISGNLFPVRGRQCSSEQMPFISQKYPSFEGFATANLGEIVGEEQLQQALHLTASVFESYVLVNNFDKDEGFTLQNLPNAAQQGPVMDAVVMDINGDRLQDLILVGSLLDVEVETVRYDGFTGTILTNNESGNWSAVPQSESGFETNISAKAIELVTSEDGQIWLIVGNNNDAVQMFSLNQ